jgi:lipopolysaccharide export system protein LptC
MNPVMRYTRFVRLGKHTLWVLIVVVLGIIIWVASDDGGDNPSRIVFSNVSKSENLQNVMVKLHYQGVDVHNQPYTVIAEKGTQLDADTVQLETINADMMRDDGKWLAMKAAAGVINTKTQQMQLTGGVNVFYEGGYEFRTDHAQIDIAQGTAYGDAPVEGQGVSGTLKADGFTVTGRGKSIRFNGSVRMKLYR